MAKNATPWYADYFKGAELHLIKTRSRKDHYFYELVRPGKPTIKWNPKIAEVIGGYPDLEDTWHSVNYPPPKGGELRVSSQGSCLVQDRTR